MLRLLPLLWLVFTTTAADKICGPCSCKDTSTADGKAVASTRIECTKFNDTFLLQLFESEKNWPYQLHPNYTNEPVIYVSFNHGGMTRVHPLPPVPIVRFAATNNKIVAIDDLAFTNVSEILQEIDLSSNQLTSKLQPNAFRGPYAPDRFQPLPKVRILNLRRNAFHSLNPDLFEHLPALEELYLDQNPVIHIDSPTSMAIATIVNLKVLSLSMTGLRKLPDTLLHTPRFLERLDLSFNHLDAVPTTVGDARELKVLILDGNPITSFHNRSMPFLPKLSKLSISSMPYLTTIEDGAFSELIELQELNCQLNPKLGLIEPYAMAENFEGRTNNLTKLYLNNNALTHLTRHLVYQWRLLEKVDLHGNPWSCDCINQWMVNDLVPILDNIDPTISPSLWCHEPPELVGKNMHDILVHSPVSSHLRCLDLYGNRPENDGAMLIGVLIGSLLAIPITAALYFGWTKRASILALCCPGIPASVNSRGGAADFSRAFYKRTSSSTVSGEY